MSRTTIPLLKFVGTVSLGLLTGVSYTIATQSLPSLLSLPTASAAITSFQQHQRQTSRHLDALLAIAVSSYGLAYFLSPPRGGRHPYLLLTSLVVAVGRVTGSFVVRTYERQNAITEARKGRRMSEIEGDEGYVDAIGASSVELNGEEVRKSMETWQFAQSVRAVISGLAFSMGVVGLWGDGASRIAR